MIWPWLLFDCYHPKSPKSRYAQCFQWFSESSEKLAVLVKNRTTLENTALYQLMPETPTIDRAPAKLHPYVKSKTQTQMHEFASCFCPYRLYPHDTLCTYGAKQLKLLGFSRWYLFWFSLMVDSTGLEPVTPCTSRAIRSYFSVF